MARKTATKPKPEGKLAISNFGIIKQVDMALTRNLIVIGGGNGQGKTSVLRAIHTCIVGKRAVEGKAPPVRDGESEGSVFLDLGDIEILRRFDAKDRYEVTLKRNGRVETSKVQDRLDALVSKMTFDPSFLWDSKVDEKTRVKMFLEAAGVDFSDLESKRAELYAQRTEIGREVARLSGALDKYPLDFDAPDAPLDVSALADQLQEQMAANSLVAQQLYQLGLRADRYEQYKKDLAEVRAQIKRFQEQERKIIEDGKSWRAETDRLTPLIEAMPHYDLTALQNQIANAAAHNKSYEAGVQRAEFGKALAEAEANRTALTAEIEKIDAGKQARLAAAKLPLEGLAATEEGIWLNGHPISRASGRDRLTVALSIAFANCDQDFPLVCCDGGEQFDPEWLPHIERMAEDAGVVVILTRVAKDAACTVIMQDGEVLSEEQFAATTLGLPPLSEFKPEELHIHENAMPPVSVTNGDEDITLLETEQESMAAIGADEDFDHDEVAYIPFVDFDEEGHGGPEEEL